MANQLKMAAISAIQTLHESGFSGRKIAKVLGVHRDSGLPLLRLAIETGITRASLIRFVRGDSSIRLDIADKLAAYFGLKLVAEKPTTREAK